MKLCQSDSYQFEVRLIESDLHNPRTDKLLKFEIKKEKTGIVYTASNHPDGPLLHVHVCTHCGSAFRREEFEDRAQTTGIYPCPKCGVESPLNIEIRDVETLDKDLGAKD